MRKSMTARHLKGPQSRCLASERRNCRMGRKGVSEPFHTAARVHGLAHKRAPETHTAPVFRETHTDPFFA
jgi:hypothetical protein